MDLLQFTDHSSHLVRHGSIEFLIPDVKMLDEFYRKRAISMEDITGIQDSSMVSDIHVHRSPMPIPAKRIIIKHVSANDEVRSQHLSVVSSQHSTRKTIFDDLRPEQRGNYFVENRPLSLADDLEPACAQSDVSKSTDKHSDHLLCAETFLDNRPSSFNAQFEDVYAALETQYTLDPSTTRNTTQEITIDVESLADRASWASLLANEGIASPIWPSGSGEDMRIDTGSVIMLGQQQVVVDGEIVELEKPREVSKSRFSLKDARWSAERQQMQSLCHTRSIRGFPGRFSMYRAEQLSWLGKETTQYTFGLTYHPNGRIVNKAFVRDPHNQVSSLDEADVMHDIVLSTAIRHAEINAARLEPLKQIRFLEERALRREIHRECALARLEGVSVGYFRYFAGHMTVEEYLAARICVCWSDCFCNKLCTKFGDMLCPCSESLELVD